MQILLLSGWFAIRADLGKVYNDPDDHTLYCHGSIKFITYTQS
jgi:hypothetical protein